MTDYPKIIKKQTNDFKFNKVKEFDISKIKDIVSAFSDEWDFDKERNKNPLGAQRETKSYWITDITEVHRLPVLKTSRKTTNNFLFSEIIKILSEIEILFDGCTARAMLALLQKNCSVYEHIDKGRLFESAHRFHIPITTNNQCSISVDSLSINIPEGECWEINNILPHSAKNLGESDRIHLIFDVIPNYLLFDEKN